MRGFPYTLNVLPFPRPYSNLRTTICGCKNMQTNKTLYKSNVLSIIECKSRIETVFYRSNPNRGTNQYTRWLVSLSRDRELAIIKKPTLRIKRSKEEFTKLLVVPIFPQGQYSERNANARENHITRERRDAAVSHFSLSPPRFAFLAWRDPTRLRFTPSTIPEEKWGLLVVWKFTIKCVMADQALAGRGRPRCQMQVTYLTLLALVT